MEKSNKTGKPFKVRSFTVERGKIKEFAMAIGDENPLYYDVGATERTRLSGYSYPTYISNCHRNVERVRF